MNEINLPRLRRGRPRIFASFLLLFGAALFAGGVSLLKVGGSPYYLCAGTATMICGILLWMGRGSGSLLYGLFLLATLVWALYESGADGWALAPRLILPCVLGLWLLTPWAHGGLARISVGAQLIDPIWGGYAALLVLVVFAGCALIAAPNTVLSASPAAARPVDASVVGADAQWSAYGGTNAGARFSTLEQLTPQNVSGLKLAWTFRTGPTPKGPGAALEVTPLKIGNSVYLCNGGNAIFSLDAETGALLWKFDPHVQVKGIIGAICRGVAFYEDKSVSATIACAQRIVTSTIDAKLWALDAKTGEPCAAFGQHGFVDLKVGLGDVPGDFEFTSAPLIASDRIILGGGWFTNNDMAGDPVLVVRAFDARTGEFIWAWNNGAHGVREPVPGQKYVPGTPNAWAPLAADEKLGLVYVPSGNATPDYWGGERTPDAERYSSSVLALDLNNGDVRWWFQTTHHDLWDYDTNSQPSLVDVDLGGGIVRALIQGTKRGEIFVLDRATGKPLVNVQEKPVPQSGVAGEHTATTQPFSVGLPSFAGPPLTESAMWGLTPLDQMYCRIKFRKARYDGSMTPPGTSPSIEYPGYKGGIGWGGISMDVDRGVMIVSTSRIALYAKLIPRQTANAILASLHGGRSRMQTQIGAPYAAEVAPFLSPIGVPCQQPPYGMLSAVDMKTQQVLWSKPFGTAQDSGPLGFESHLPFTMGVPNDGAAVTTRTGLTFIGATQERAFRAIDTLTGQLLWKVRVPAGPQATPMTYLSAASGRQFVVLAAGGHPSMHTKPGDYILAYALPQKAP